MIGVVFSLVSAVIAIGAAVMFIILVLDVALRFYIDAREKLCESSRAADIRRARSPKKIQDSQSRDIKQRKVAVNSDAIEKRESKEVRKPDASS